MRGYERGFRVPNKTVSGSAPPSPRSAAEDSTDAILEVASKLSEIVTEHEDLSLRLLVTRPDQTGAIIGRGGNTIERLRRDFRDADIHLRPLDFFSSHQTAPLFDPSKTVEILEISGRNHDEVLDALRPVADVLASKFSSGDNSHSAQGRAAEPERGGSSGRGTGDKHDNSSSVMFRVMVSRSQIGQLIGVRGRVRPLSCPQSAPSSLLLLPPALLLLLQHIKRFTV